MDRRPALNEGETRARLLLSFLPGLGGRRLRELLRAFGSAEAALAAPVTDFEVLAGPGSGACREDRALRSEVESTLDRCRRVGVAILAPGHIGYPVALQCLEHEAPPLLFSYGVLQADRPRRVAVVGARRASAYGRRVARRLGRELAEQGCTVLSGMALGVDGEAHGGALEGGGVTLAVLGSGPERAYPSVHRELHARIAASGGILSEYPPGTAARPHHFPLRNLVLAALAEAVVVVEATSRSGALITARAANDMGRCVLAVPGSVESPLSAGTLDLLREGAAPAASAVHVLDYAGWAPLRPDGQVVATPDGLGRVEGSLWSLLGPEPRGVEELAREAGLPPVRVMAALGILEVGGWAAPVPGGRFIRRDAGAGA
jgi:DNA processing protein